MVEPTLWELGCPSCYITCIVFSQPYCWTFNKMIIKNITYIDGCYRTVFGWYRRHGQPNSIQFGHSGVARPATVQSWLGAGSKSSGVREFVSFSLILPQLAQWNYSDMHKWNCWQKSKSYIREGLGGGTGYGRDLLCPSQSPPGLKWPLFHLTPTVIPLPALLCPVPISAELGCTTGCSFDPAPAGQEGLFLSAPYLHGVPNVL